MYFDLSEELISTQKEGEAWTNDLTSWANSLHLNGLAGLPDLFGQTFIKGRL